MNKDKQIDLKQLSARIQFFSYFFCNFFVALFIM